MKMPSMQEEEQEVAMIILTVLHVLLTAVTGVTVKKLQDMEALNQKKKMHAHLGGSAKELVQLKEETYGEVVAPLELLIPISAEQDEYDDRYFIEMLFQFEFIN